MRQIIVEINLDRDKNSGTESFIIKIQDNGIGISSNHFSRIFDPFFTTKDEGQGTGLGLSTVYLILERHDGTIEFDSKQGEGTTFTIQLPLVGASDIQRRYKNV